MSASGQSLTAAAAASILIALVACAGPSVGSRASLPRPILLSPKDKVTPATRLQIELANYQIQQLAEQYEQFHRVSLPVP